MKKGVNLETIYANSSELDGLSWFIMVYHGLSWFIMVYHGLSWFIMVYHGLSWNEISVQKSYSSGTPWRRALRIREIAGGNPTGHCEFVLLSPEATL